VSEEVGADSERQNSELSFISESDDDTDEYGDISQYGSKNYSAGSSTLLVALSDIHTQELI
jgi:hypothetical protein